MVGPNLWREGRPRRICFRSGTGKKVRTEFERAVELDPKNSEARADLAEFYIEAPSIVGGGKDKARAQAEALAGFDPAPRTM